MYSSALLVNLPFSSGGILSTSPLQRLYTSSCQFTGLRRVVFFLFFFSLPPREAVQGPEQRAEAL